PQTDPLSLADALPIYEMHQRNVACSSLFLRELAPALARTAKDTDRLAEVLGFIGANDQFFLNVAMAMGKAMTDPAYGVPGSSVVDRKSTRLNSSHVKI